MPHGDEPYVESSTRSYRSRFLVGREGFEPPRPKPGRLQRLDVSYDRIYPSWSLYGLRTTYVLDIRRLRRS